MQNAINTTQKPTKINLKQSKSIKAKLKSKDAKPIPKHESKSQANDKSKAKLNSNTTTTFKHGSNRKSNDSKTQLNATHSIIIDDGNDFAIDSDFCLLEADESAEDGREYKPPHDAKSMNEVLTTHWNSSEDECIETETDEEDEEKESYGYDRFVELIWQCQECKKYNNDVELVCFCVKGEIIMI